MHGNSPIIYNIAIVFSIKYIASLIQAYLLTIDSCSRFVSLHKKKMHKRKIGSGTRLHKPVFMHFFKRFKTNKFNS